MAADFMSQRRFSFEPQEFINSESKTNMLRKNPRYSNSSDGSTSSSSNSSGIPTSNFSSNNSDSIGTSTLSRRRSMSPLFSPIVGLNGHITPAMLQRNKLDPNFPQTEDEHLYLFHERIIWNQEKSLLPLAHDLADWLNSLLEIPYITPSNLMEKLESGVILCQLAKLIEDKAATFDQMKLKLKGRIRYNAPIGSFFARDNIAMFINFCKDLGVHSNLLFETEDLVTHGEIRSILVCLLEVGRLSVKFGVDPPMLVTFENQIDREVAGADSQHGTGTNTTTDEESQDDETNKENSKHNLISSSTQVNLLSDSIDSGLHVDDDNSVPVNHRPKDLIPKKSELDVKVNEVARRSGVHCHCVEETRANFKLRKLSEGKYIINGRTVFVRLLKGVHVMVRIGGGWETLEEFLVRNDPCRGKHGNTRHICSASAASTPTGINTFRQPFGYNCSNYSSRHSIRALTPSSSITLYGKGRPVSSPPIMMSKPNVVAGPRSFSNTATPVNSRSRHSSRSNSIIT